MIGRIFGTLIISRLKGSSWSQCWTQNWWTSTTGLCSIPMTEPLSGTSCSWVKLSVTLILFSLGRCGPKYVRKKSIPIQVMRQRYSCSTSWSFARSTFTRRTLLQQLYSPSFSLGFVHRKSVLEQ